MKLAISGAFQPPGDLVPIAQAAEESGFEAISFSDHVVYPETLDTPYPYTADGRRRYDETTEFPDPWVVSGALSTITDRLRFTTNVFVVPMPWVLYHGLTDDIVKEVDGIKRFAEDGIAPFGRG